MAGFATIGLEGLPAVLHWESIYAIKLSHEIDMPSEVALRNVAPTPDREFRADDAADLEDFRIARGQHKFIFATQARQSEARTNRVHGMLLGVDGAGNNIWASLVSGRADQYACDAPHRAFVQLQLIEDMRAVVNGQVVLVTGLASLEVVAHWHQGIRGNTMASRYRFAYDALVEEAKGHSG